MTDTDANATAVAQAVAPSAARWVVPLVLLLSAAGLAGFYVDHARQASLEIEGVRYFWLDDDQMISMRYARNWADGLGLVWNAGERVEGYSNFLWVCVMALVHLLHPPDALASVFLLAANYMLHVVLVGLSIALLRTLFPAGRLAIALVAAAIVFSLDILYWSANGFETTLLAVLQTAFLLSLLTRGERWHGCLALALIPLARGDGAHIWVGDALLTLFLSKDRTRSLRWLGVSLLPMLAHFVGRRVYYGDWLPNTYYLKSQGLPDKTERGLMYAGRFLLRYGVLLAIGAGTAWHAARTDKRALALFTTVVPTLLYTVLVGGDNFDHSRFFTHVLPVVCVFGVGAASALLTSKPGQVGLLAALAVTLIPRTGIQGLYEPTVNGDPAIQVVVGVMLRQQALPDSSVAVIPAGFVPYFSRLRAIDLLGKSDAYIAHLPYAPGGHAAHGKYDPEYSFGRNPDLFVSCTRRVEAAQARQALEEAETPGAEYRLAHLASEAFRTRYLRWRIDTPFLGSYSNIYTHQGSPEFERRSQWHDLEVVRP
ncbi:MAG: hypothetical protein KC593_08065 [Myxococcales bacterium]|nr:hypothetical protein [Myxococcales bacterium]MCB9630359.1 hypothetical protein [Sandaracinaceae bacterium]